MQDTMKRALSDMCKYCKTKPENCNKNKCKRYNIFKFLIYWFRNS